MPAPYQQVRDDWIISPTGRAWLRGHAHKTDGRCQDGRPKGHGIAVIQPFTAAHASRRETHLNRGLPAGRCRLCRERSIRDGTFRFAQRDGDAHWARRRGCGRAHARRQRPDVGRFGSGSQEGAGKSAGRCQEGRPAGAGAPQSARVKLCEAGATVSKDKDGKEKKQDIKVCMTMHERLDGNSGMTVVSAAVRQVEGQDKIVLHDHGADRGRAWPRHACNLRPRATAGRRP